MIRHSGSETEENQLFEALGEVVVTWNACETKLRLLLYQLCGGGDVLDVLVHSLSNVYLTDAVEAISDTFDDDLRGHLVHASKTFTRLRDHRNYLVHGPISTASSAGVAVLMVQEVAPKKGKLKLHQNVLTEITFQEVILNLRYLADYLDQLRSIAAGMPTAPLISSLEKRSLPDRISRASRNLIERRLRPQPFQE